MIPLIQNIINTAPISFDDNYKIRLKNRLDILNKRRDKLNTCRCRGSVEYDSKGKAVRFYPAIHYRKDFKRLHKMIAQIDKEINEIWNIIH